MLYWSLVFLVVAIIAAVFGFAGIATAAAGIAKLLFYIFLVIFVISLIMGLMKRGSTSDGTVYVTDTDGGRIHARPSSPQCLSVAYSKFPSYPAEKSG